MNDFFALAEPQYGVVTRAQLLECGLSERQDDHRVATGTLQRVYPGVYRVRGSYPSRRQRAMAAVLWCGADALLSRGSASTLLRLPIAEPAKLHVSVPHAIRRCGDEIVLHRTTKLTRADRYVVEGLPCTSPTRTIIDLATQLDGEALEHAFEAARRMRLTTTAMIERRIGNDRAPAKLRDLLSLVQAQPKESRLEVRTAGLLRKHAIESGECGERWARQPTRRETTAKRPDGSGAWSRPVVMKRDRRGIAELEAAGWRVMHLTWEDVTNRPEETVHRIRGII